MEGSHVIFDLLFVVCSFGGFSLIHLEHKTSIEEMKSIYIYVSTTAISKLSGYVIVYAVKQQQRNTAKSKLFASQRVLQLRDFFYRMEDGLKVLFEKLCFIS